MLTKELLTRSKDKKHNWKVWQSAQKTNFFILKAFFLVTKEKKEEKQRLPLAEETLAAAQGKHYYHSDIDENGQLTAC